LSKVIAGLFGGCASLIHPTSESGLQELLGDARLCHFSLALLFFVWASVGWISVSASTVFLFYSGGGILPLKQAAEKEQ
jgi:hypothetical protein